MDQRRRNAGSVQSVQSGGLVLRGNGRRIRRRWWQRSDGVQGVEDGGTRRVTEQDRTGTDRAVEARPLCWSERRRRRQRSRQGRQRLVRSLQCNQRAGRSAGERAPSSLGLVGHEWLLKRGCLPNCPSALAETPMHTRADLSSPATSATSIPAIDHVVYIIRPNYPPL